MPYTPYRPPQPLETEDLFTKVLAGYQQGLAFKAQQEEMARRQQEQQRRDELARQEIERDQFDRQMRMEHLKLAKQDHEGKIKRAAMDDKLAEWDLRQKAQSLQGMQPPIAQDVGIQQSVPDVGPDVSQINVPQPTMGIPSPTGGPDIQMALLTAGQQQKMAQAEEQRKMRALLGMEQVKLAAAEPFKIADDQRTAARMERSASASDARSAARETQREGKQSLQQENRLRTEFNRETDKLRQGLTDLDRYASPVQKSIEAGKKPTPADQFALIYAFNKALDPGSTVREGEFNNSRGVGAGVTEQAFLALQRLKDGSQLAPEQITQMMDTIRRARSSTEQSLQAITSKYGDMAASYGVDPSRVVTLGSSGGSKSSKPSVVINGVTVEEVN